MKVVKTVYVWNVACVLANRVIVSTPAHFFKTFFFNTLLLLKAGQAMMLHSERLSQMCLIDFDTHEATNIVARLVLPSLPLVTVLPLC